MPLAAVFGAARAATVRLWVRDGQPWTQGNLLTAGLWVLALAAHLGYDYVVGQHKDIGGVGSATLVLYPAVTLGVQRVIVSQRALRLSPTAGPALSQAAASRQSTGAGGPVPSHTVVGTARTVGERGTIAPAVSPGALAAYLRGQRNRDEA